MKYFYILCLIYLVGVQQCRACINPAEKTIFDKTQILGDWYLVASGTTDPAIRCLKLTINDFSNNPSPYYSVDLYKIENEVESSTIPLFKWYFTSTVSPGKFTEKLADETAVSTVIIVDTDYSTYMIVYRCTTTGVSSSDSVELWSKSPDGYNAANTGAAASITTAGLNSLPLNQVNNDCSPPTTTTTTTQSSSGKKNIYNKLKSKLNG